MSPKTSVFLILFSILCSSIARVNCEATSFFPVNSELLYKLKSHVGVGTTTSAEYQSHFSIYANVRIQTDETNRVLFQFEDVKNGIWNGPVEGLKVVDDFSTIDIPKDAGCACGIPFAATYENGQVTSFEYSDTDPLWSRNIKRAIVAQFQLQLPIQQAVFYTSETGISGICKAENTIIKSGAQTKVWKIIPINSCNEPSLTHSNLLSIRCPSSASQEPTMSNTQRIYDLKMTETEVLIENIQSESGITYQPFSYQGQLYYQFTNSTLKLLKTESVSSRIEIPGELKKSNLIFEFPLPDHKSGAGTDSHFERTTPKHIELYKQKILTLLNEMAEDLKNSTSKDDDILKIVDKLHNTDLNVILFMLRHLDTQTLKDLSETIFIGTSDKHEAVSKLFMKYLPLVGSRASVLLLIDLIRGEKVDNFDKLDYITTMPFYIRDPDVQLLIDTKILLDMGDEVASSIKHSSILAYATMLGKACKDGKCQATFLDESLKYFFQQLRDSTSYSEKVVYLQALNNVHVPQLLSYIEPIIVGKFNDSHQLRYRAVWVLKDLLVFAPMKSYEIYWPMLLNREEHYEMRAAALTMLLATIPTQEMYSKLLWFLLAEDNPHLFNIYYSTIRSLVNIKNPCFIHISSLAARMLNVVEFFAKDPLPATSGNYLVDYKLPGLDIGGHFHLHAVGNPDTGELSSAYIDFATHHNGIMDSSDSFAVRVDGSSYIINVIVKALTSKPEIDKTNVKEILKTLSILEDETKEERIHFELLKFSQGRTVYIFDFNTTAVLKAVELMSMVKGKLVEQATTMTSETVPLNLHVIQDPRMTDNVRPNDLGIPVTISMINPAHLSITGNIIFKNDQNAFHTSILADTRSYAHRNIGIHLFNPLTTLWHGVYTKAVGSIESPLSLDIAYDKALGFKVTSQWDKHRLSFDLIHHKRSYVYVGGYNTEELLKQACPNCQKKYIVTNHDDKMNKQLSKISFLDSELQWTINLFDCDQPHFLQNPSQAASTFLSKSDNNYRAAPHFGFLYLGVLQFLSQMEMNMLIGSCGLRATIEPIGDAVSTAIQFKIDKKDNKFLTKLTQTYKNDKNEIFKTWDAQLIFKTSSTLKELSLKAKVTRNFEGQPQQVGCLEVDSTETDDTDIYNWDLLTSTSNSKSKTTKNFALTYGQSNDGKCTDKGLSININQNSFIDEKNSEDIKECEKDKGKNKWYPASKHCLNAADQLNSNRNITYKIKYNNLPKRLESIITRAHTYLHENYPECIQKDLQNEILMDVSTRYTGMISVNGRPCTKSNALLRLLKAASTSPHFGYISQSMKLLKSCIIAGDNVASFDKTTIPYKALEDKYTLLSADCRSKNPSFAVFTKQVGNSLGVKIYFLNDTIEIKSDKDSGVNVVFNKQVATTSTLPKNIIIRQRKNGYVRVYEKNIHVAIRRTESELIISIPTSFYGHTCGLCGDSNNAVENLQAFPGPKNQKLSSENIIQAYTLPN